MKYPVVRLLARVLDLTIYLFIIMLILLFYTFLVSLIDGTENFVISNSYIFYVSVTLLLILLESYLFMIWGTSIGKKILKISIERVDNKPIDFNSAFKRTVLMWIFGLGLNLPVIQVVTMVLAYNDIRNGKQTYWDRKSGFIVEGKEITPWDLLIALIFLTAFVLSLIVFLFYDKL